MVAARRDSGEVDTYVNEQETDVEEGGTMLEEKRGRKVGGMKEVGRYNGDHVDSGVEENDDDGGIEKADVDDVDVDADGKDVQVVPLIQTLFLNLTQVTYCHPVHIYVSLVEYLVPHHHLLIELIQVHLRLGSRVFLCGKRKEKVCAKMWVHIFSMTTTDKQNQQHLRSIRQSYIWSQS